MQEQISKRLNELKAEYEVGQRMLVDLAAKQANLQEILLRISGAIQVLTEMQDSTQGLDGVVSPSTVKMPCA